MGISLTNVFKKVFKELTSEMGFKQKGSLFIRVVKQEIIQTVYLFKGSTPMQFTLNIGVFPICTENNIILFKEGNFRLEDFKKNHYTWWEYNPFNFDDMLSTINEASEFFMENVYPILNEVTDCRKYLDFINRYEIERYGEILWNDNFKLYSYMKISDYEKVIKVIDAIETQNKDAALSNRNIYTEEEYKEYLEEIEADIAELSNIRMAVIEGNKEFINSLLCKNENAAKDILKAYGFNF